MVVHSSDMEHSFLHRSGFCRKRWFRMSNSLAIVVDSPSITMWQINSNMKREYFHHLHVLNAWNFESRKQLVRMVRLPVVSRKLVPVKKLEGLSSDTSSLSALLPHNSHTDLSSKAQVIWDEMLSGGDVPDAQIITQLIVIHASIGDFDTIREILHHVQLKDDNILPHICKLCVSCFGKNGKLECMEFMLKEIVSMGYPVDSATGNAYLMYYSTFGSLADTEYAYGRFKRSRILIEKEAIKAISLAYIRNKKFYALGQFLRNIGLGRRDVGNLLWNLLLLSYAANFKMKSLQREFVKMVEAGFKPDLNTFNIRAIAFSKMSLIWDLHLSLEHMNHTSVVPDLVTYGCVVDAYFDRRLARNLEFPLSKLNWYICVSMLTDPLVFEVMGKGDFHASSEVLLDNLPRKDWNYKTLIGIYLKKKFRSNQIFWNY